jgi:hypothetical protein
MFGKKNNNGYDKKNFKKPIIFYTREKLFRQLPDIVPANIFKNFRGVCPLKNIKHSCTHTCTIYATHEKWTIERAGWIDNGNKSYHFFVYITGEKENPSIIWWVDFRGQNYSVKYKKICTTKNMGELWSSINWLSGYSPTSPYKNNNSLDIGKEYLGENTGWFFTIGKIWKHDKLITCQSLKDSDKINKLGIKDDKCLWHTRGTIIGFNEGDEVWPYITGVLMFVASSLIYDAVDQVGNIKQLHGFTIYPLKTKNKCEIRFTAYWDRDYVNVINYDIMEKSIEWGSEIAKNNEKQELAKNMMKWKIGNRFSF